MNRSVFIQTHQNITLIGLDSNGALSLSLLQNKKEGNEYKNCPEQNIIKFVLFRIKGKSMKNYTLTFLVIIFSLLSTACKKEKSPELEVTILDMDGQGVPRAYVRTSIPGANHGVVNTQVLDSVQTDEFGKAFFKYDNTILIRVDAFYQGTLRDSLDVLLETKRLRRSDDNNYERTMRIEI